MGNRGDTFVKSVQSVLVLGGGSAGFLAAISLRTRLPELPVTVLRSPELGIIGVGEATTPYLPDHLHGYLGMDPAEFYRLARPSWKLGIKFLWGPRTHFNYTFDSQCDSQYQALPKSTGFYYEDEFGFGCRASALMNANRVFIRNEQGVPFIDRDTAYHLENETFVAYLEQHARRLGIAIRDDTVTRVEQNDDGVAWLELASGARADADLFVDCSGFRSLLLGKTLAEPFVSFASSLFCNRAVIGGWMRHADEPILPYTTAETMTTGWSWRIDHEERINRGYVYSQAFISDEAAEQEFRAKNPLLTDTRVVKFVSGRYERAWVKNVVAIGNAAGFVEPLESTSLGAICAETQGITETLVDSHCQPTASHRRQFNHRNARTWDSYRAFLALHYRFNTRLATPFWEACCRDVDLAGAEEVVEYYRENGPSVIWRDTLLDRFDVFKLDGYLTLLLGQRVPHARPYVPTAAEKDTWRKIQTLYRRDAATAFTCEEALKFVHSPDWQWNKDFWKTPRTSGG